MTYLTFFRLRTTIPLILIFYSLVVGTLFLQSHLSWINNSIEQEARTNLRVRISQTQRTLEYFLLRNDSTTVQQNIAVLSLDPRALHIYLISDQGMVLASSNLGHVKESLATVLQSSSSQVRELLTHTNIHHIPTANHTIDISLSTDGNGLLSATNIALPGGTATTQEHRHATLYLYQDLLMAKKTAHHAIIEQVLTYSLFLLLLALILWSYFHVAVDRRIARLSRMADELGQGNYDAKSDVGGNDELAALAHSFEQMRDNLVRSFETVRNREEKLQETQALARLGSWELDVATGQVEWSEETYRIFALNEDAPITLQSFLATVHPDDRPGVEQAIHDSIRNATPLTLDYRIVMPGGEIRYLHEESEVVVDDTGTVIQRKGAVQDVSERKSVEQAMERANQEWAVAMDASDDVIYLLDRRRRLIRANRLFYQLTHCTPDAAVGRPIMELMHPQHDAHLCPVCRAQEKWHDGIITLEGDEPNNPFGHPIEVKIKVIRDKEGQPLSMLVTIHDLTNARKEQEDKTLLEKQLQQAQKMEAVGTLAGGIAHDFNNILTPIIGYTELALEHVEPGSNTARDLAEVLRAGKRAKELVSHILTFSRQSDQELHPLLVQLVVKEALKLLRASIPSTIEFKTNIDGQCGAVLADPTLIHQVMMNLCTNAYHAMRDTGGVLTVNLSQVVLGPHDLGTAAKLAVGEHILLEVGDTGHGMSPEVLERIFEPYFTTKPQGKGTGLGLSVVHGIISKLGGHIRASSVPGQGTTFEIYLPVVTDSVPEQETQEAGQLPGGTERILVVDDEETVIKLLTHVLRSLGYEVHSFSSSEAALRAFQEEPQNFDLLITDLTMPHLTGKQLAREILARRPDLPIIMCTGFSAVLSDEEAQAMGIRQVLFKPIAKMELAQAIRQALTPEDNG